MTDDEKHLVFEAAMDQEAAFVRDLGPLVTLSSMELTVLVNLARLACLDYLLGELDDVEERNATSAERNDFVACLNAWFTAIDGQSGVVRLVESCVAMLGTERIGPYVVPSADADEGKDADGTDREAAG
jgi:hypothetical protein